MQVKTNPTILLKMFNDVSSRVDGLTIKNIDDLRKYCEHALDEQTHPEFVEVSDGFVTLDSVVYYFESGSPEKPKKQMVRDIVFAFSYLEDAVLKSRMSIEEPFIEAYAVEPPTRSRTGLRDMYDGVYHINELKQIWWLAKAGFELVNFEHDRSHDENLKAFPSSYAVNPPIPHYRHWTGEE